MGAGIIMIKYICVRRKHLKKLKTTEQAWCYGSKLDQGHVGAAVCWSLGEIKQLVSGREKVYS